jgi:hypothetical protein
MDDILTRMGQNLLGRIDGQLAMRLIVQPIMAAIFATRDGIRDAREGRPPYLWSLIANRSHRGHRLRDGWRSIRTVFVAALVLDVIYQILELGWIYLGEALIMAARLGPLCAAARPRQPDRQLGIVTGLRPRTRGPF